MHKRPDLVAEINELARSDLSLKEFYRELLPRLTEQTRAEGTAVWVCGEESIELFAVHGLDRSVLSGEGAFERHRLLLAKVQQAGQPAFVMPKSAGESSTWANPTDYLLGVAPLKVDDTVVALLESFHPKNAEPSDRDEQLRLLRTVAGIAARFHASAELRQLRRGHEWWKQLDRFSQAVHDTLHPVQTAYAIANEGRLLIGCDRVSVALRRGRKCRVVAVSGQDSVNRRANTIVLLESLAARVTAVGEPLFYPTSDASLPPQLEEAIDLYVDNAQSKYLAVYPLVEGQAVDDADPQASAASHNVIGAMVAEQFSGEPLSGDLVERVGRHAGSALGNAVTHHRIFLLPLWAAIGKLKWLVQARNVPKVLVAVLLLAAIVAALVLVPARFELSAEGTLQPAIQRHVFSQADGVVTQLLVRHGSRVEEGSPLVRLRSSEIDLQLAEIRGELETTSKKLTATKAARTAKSNSPDRAALNALAAEEEELRQWLSSLRHQQQLLLERKDTLLVRSPIEGEAITWDLEDLLMARPVNRGDALMTVAQTAGSWVLEVLLPDQRVGHLRDAQAELGRDLEVTFILATNPGEKLQGTIKKTGEASIIDEQQGLCLPVTVDFEEDQIEYLRPGARVIAKIYCGQRSVGYVWLHELMEFFQTRVLFPLGW